MDHRPEPPGRLARHLTRVLLLKAIALLLLWYFFFSPAHRLAVDATRLGEHLFSAREVAADE